MSQLIDGKKIAERIKDKVTQEIYKLGQRPNLAIILVGGRGDSELYVNLKEREAKKVGIDTHLYKMPENISEEEVIETIKFLNIDESIDAILVQLPLPKQLNTNKVIETIDPEKDVDGFHPDNINNLKKGNINVLSPVFGAVLEMLNEIHCESKNKNIVILSNTDIFRDSLATLLKQLGGNTKTFSAEDKKSIASIKNADILISAIGKPHFIKKEMVKKDAVIIDIGITKDGKRVKGDVDFNDVEDHCAYITPVPGGVGPLTIAMTFQNTLKLFKK